MKELTLAEKQLAEYDEDLVVHTSIGDVPVYKFIEKFLWIRTKKGSIIKFILNQEQVDLYKAICEQRRKGEPIRINILKARQIGFSTFIAALYFCLVIFSPNKRAIIVADTAEHATNLFDKYKLFYERLPKEIKIPKKASNAKMLVVDYGDGNTSEIKIVCEGENAARSDTAQFLHNSEAAFWKDLRGTMASLNQVVDITNPDSFIIFETTGNGYNDYKAKWDRDYAGKSDYVALFYPWWGNPEYTAVYHGFELLPHEEELMESLNLTYEQIAWYRLQYNAVEGDIDLLRQEYPSTPVEAFRSTGNSVFDLGLIQARKEEVMDLKPLYQGRFIYEHKHSEDGSRITLISGGLKSFARNKAGDVKIFKEVNPTHYYVINCDPAMGGEDYYAIQVLDNITGEQVAVYHQNKANDDDVAYTMVCLGRYYNDALLCAETNTNSYVLQIVDKCGYKFIYQDKDFDALTSRYQDRFGYKTKTTNRSGMIAMFKEAFRDNYKMINDYETLCEMEAFQIIRNDNTQKEKAMALSGFHDDLVMAMCGIFLIRSEQRFTPRKEKKFVKDIEDSPFRRNKIKRENEVYQIWD
jgi:hypothetical protein